MLVSEGTMMNKIRQGPCVHRAHNPVGETDVNKIITLTNVKLETGKYCEEKEHGSVISLN
jgi:hypothetical protein